MKKFAVIAIIAAAAIAALCTGCENPTNAWATQCLNGAAEHVQGGK